jgi:indole-3-glycerol phosphate synthase
MSVLDRIVAHKRWEVAAQKRLLPQAELEARAAAAPKARDFAAALRRGAAPRVVAELKRASPSRGALQPAADAGHVASAYADAGAVALSVLTDGRFFWGSLLDLWRARESVSLPVLRKDFVVAPYQVYEARAHGADAVLLLCSVLDDRHLAEIGALVRFWGMTPVVEAHDEREVDRALSVESAVVGVNNRDLKSMTLVRGRAEALRTRIPEGRLALAESGIRTREDLTRLAAAGYDACLVGEVLMSAEHPGHALRELLAR